MTPTNISVNTVLSLNFTYSQISYIFFFFPKMSRYKLFVHLPGVYECIWLRIVVLRFNVSLNCLKMRLTFMYWVKKGLVLTRDPLEKHISLYDNYVYSFFPFGCYNNILNHFLCTDLVKHELFFICYLN